MNNYTLDFLVNSNDFEHSQTFVTIEDFNKEVIFRQSEIERLEKENAELKEQVKRMDTQHKCGECGNVVLWYDQVHYLDIINEKDQIIDKAEKVIDEIILDIERCDRYFQSSGTKNQFQRKQESRKKQYFQDKDKE